jgi:hypothetical protein
MAKLTDPEILRCYENALKNWRYDGFVVFEKDAAEGLRRHLPGQTQKSVKELLFKFILMEGGDVDQVTETRENWRDRWSHHYDVRPVVDGVKMYVETRLFYTKADDPDDPIIYVVNIHPA